MPSDAYHRTGPMLDDFKGNFRTTTPDDYLEFLYERAERGDPPERDICLRTLTRIPDPGLEEKIAFLQNVLTADDTDPETRALVRALGTTFSIRFVIPLVHLLRREDVSSSDLRTKIKCMLVEMGDVAIVPIIQLFRYDDQTYYESVLPVLKSIGPASVDALQTARRSDDTTIQKYAMRAIWALQGPYQVSQSRKIVQERLRDDDDLIGSPEDDWYEDTGDEYDETAESMGYGSFWYENYDEIYDSMASR